MTDESHGISTDAPPAFVPRMRRVIDAVVERHGDRLSVLHGHQDRSGSRGWSSTVHVVGRPEVEAVFWYDGIDDDVMAMGDARFGEWWPNDDDQAAQTCLREIEERVRELAGAGRDALGARAGRRRHPWWRRSFGRPASGDPHGQSS